MSIEDSTMAEKSFSEDVKARAMREALMTLADEMGERGQQSITQLELVEFARTRWADAPRLGHPLCHFCAGFGSFNGVACGHCSKPIIWTMLEDRRYAQAIEAEDRYPCMFDDCDASLLFPWHKCLKCDRNQIPF